MSQQPDLFQSVAAYDWDNDIEFQRGLSTIIESSAADASKKAHLTRRAQCYFYARKFGTTVPIEPYEAWLEARDDPLAESRAEPQETTMSAQSKTHVLSPYGDAPAPASFADLCRMIAEGVPVPGIKDIPDTVLEGQSSESITSRRKKPWENTTTLMPSTPSWQT